MSERTTCCLCRGLQPSLCQPLDLCPGSVSPLSGGGGERFGVGVETRSSSRNSGNLVCMETRSNSKNSGSLVGMVSETSSVSSDDVGSVGSGSNPMLAQVAALHNSQAEALTPQTKVVSLQSLPPYQCILGRIETLLMIVLSCGLKNSRKG